MRKLLLLLSLFLTLHVSGQTFYEVVSSQGVAAAGGGSYETEYNAVLTAMATDPDETNKGYQNTLVAALKTAGVWTKADVIYVPAVHTNGGGEAYINWKSPGTYNLSDPGSTAPTFTAYEGFVGDGTSDYLSLNFNPSTNGVNYTQDAVSMLVYNRVNRAENGGVVLGAETSADRLADLMLFTETYIEGWLNSVGAPGYNTFRVTNSGGSHGLLGAVRRSSTEIEFYRNGSSLGSPANAQNSAGIPNASFYVLARNYDGGAGQYATDQVSFIFIGGALTDGEVTSINSAIEAYMDSLGKGVQ